MFIVNPSMLPNGRKGSITGTYREPAAGCDGLTSVCGDVNISMPITVCSTFCAAVGLLVRSILCPSTINALADPGGKFFATSPDVSCAPKRNFNKLGAASLLFGL